MKKAFEMIICGIALVLLCGYAYDAASSMSDSQATGEAIAKALILITGVMAGRAL